MLECNNDLYHSMTYADLEHFITLQGHLSLDMISLLDMNLLNQIPFLIGSLLGWRMLYGMLIFFLLLLLILQLLLGKAVNASRALNYYMHMVIICLEAMAGNHSIRRCKALVCKWTRFVDC
jgi:hypothetical protein